MRRYPCLPNPIRQHGAVLLVAMIFMVVLMLIVTSAIRLTNVNTRIAGNMQTQNEAEAAGRQAIEAAISRDQLQTLPATQVYPVDIDNSGRTGSTYSVTIAPQLVACQKLDGTAVAVNFSAPGDMSPYNSQADAQPIRGEQVQVWDIGATVQAPNTAQPVATLHQGVMQRSSSGACS